ncbi:1-acyl-sn-glycerol-3-phosphate acyltransferase (fragment) [Carnobacterium maltaromaticum]
MFPSGTRHSNDLKGGAATIAKLSGAPIVPAVFQGPLTIKGLLSRKRVTVNFGEPIYLDKKVKLTKETLKDIEDQMQAAFDQLDAEIDPNYKYEAK